MVWSDFLFMIKELENRLSPMLSRPVDILGAYVLVPIPRIGGAA
jgi:hypothetical protein